MSENNGKLIFDVIDTGIGMTEEQIHLLVPALLPGRQFINSSLFGWHWTRVSDQQTEWLNCSAAILSFRSSPGQGSTFSLSIATGNVENSVITKEPSKAVSAREPV